jgi:hypothetical protein
MADVTEKDRTAGANQRRATVKVENNSERGNKPKQNKA